MSFCAGLKEIAFSSISSDHCSEISLSAANVIFFASIRSKSIRSLVLTCKFNHLSIT